MINISEKKSLTTLIDIEKSSLSATLSIQKNLNKQVLIFMKNFIGNIDITNELDSKGIAVKYIKKSAQALNESNANIESIKKLLVYIDAIKNILVNFDSSNETPKKLSNTDIINLINKYNSEFVRVINFIHNNTKSIEDFIHEISILDISKTLETINSDKPNLPDEIANANTISSEELSSSFIENTLVISEFRKKVILPYKLDTVQKLLLEKPNVYSSIQNVIDKVYTKSLNRYKVASVARFREMYKLLTKKEKYSIRKALPLATEIFFYYNLHPAIITACNSLDELDIYLACLDDNTLEDFHFFDIKFEVPPALIS